MSPSSRLRNGIRRLTRARDATIVFVPQLTELNSTYDFLVDSGFRPLSPE